MAKILLVDDYDPFRKLARLILQQAGHSVVEACDGKQALVAFQADIPDLVITDLFMPEKEGMQTIMELRKISPNVRIIAVSGGLPDCDVDFLRIAQHLGAQRVLAKPFQNSELLSAVDAVLAGK